jgi:hypothetical protein
MNRLLLERATAMRAATDFSAACCEPAFKVFLQERFNLDTVPTDDGAVSTVLHMLGIRWPEESQSDEAAAAQWQQIRKEFQEWRVS